MPRRNGHDQLSVREKKLVRQYLPLAYKCLGYHRKLVSQYLDRDEAVERAFTGICYAVQCFDPKRGYKFVTYAVACVRGELLHGLMYHRRPCRSAHKTVALSHKVISGQVDKSRPVGCELDDQDEVREAMRYIHPSEQRVLLAYVEHGGLAAAGLELGMCKQRVSQIIVNVRRRMSGRRHKLGGSHAVV